MVSKKFWSWILIGSQFAWGSVAFAAPSEGQTPAHTSEFALVESLNEIRGENLSTEAMRAQMTAEISQYAKTANPAGEDLRLEQAFVALDMYTPEQAQNFVADAEEGARELRSSDLSTVDAQSSATTAELIRLSTLFPTGAEFSACTADRIALFGGFALFAAPVMANNGQLFSNEQPAYDISIAGGILTLVAFSASLAGACS